MHRIFSKITSLVILLFFFQGCSYWAHCPWNLEVTQTRCYDYRSARVYIPSHTMGMEFVRGSYGIRMYLNLMVCPVSTCVDAEFTYIINDTKFQGRYSSMEGGQRLFVREDDADAMVDALRNGESVRIQVGMYDDIFESANFPPLIEWLQRWEICGSS